MDKHKLILPVSILLGCVILGGFYYKVEITKQALLEKQQLIKLEADKKADYFKKKTECEKYKNEIIKNVEQNNSSKFSLRTEILEELFYSPKENSCLYTIVTYDDTGNREYLVFNALTNSKITSFQFSSQFEEYKKFIFDYSNSEIRF